MAIKDYYVVLGVPRDSSPSGIRTAYRKLAKRFHPDRAGSRGTSAFQEIVEAYGVLSDPERRRAHDRMLDPAAAPPGRRAPEAGFTSVVEPLRSGRRYREQGDARVGIPWAESLPRLELLVTLSRREASLGGVVPVGIPVYRNCSDCGGRLFSRLLCLQCGGSGLERRVEPVAIRFPAGVRSGSVIDFSPSVEGIRVDLRLRLFVLQRG